MPVNRQVQEAASIHGHHYRLADKSSKCALCMTSRKLADHFVNNEPQQITYRYKFATNLGKIVKELKQSFKMTVLFYELLSEVAY